MKPEQMTDDQRGSLTVSDVMSHDPLECHPDDRLLDITARMQQHRIRHLPVVSGDRKVLGMISDRDVRNAIGDPATWLEKPAAPLEELRVTGAMSEPPVTISPDAPLADAIRRLVELEIGALPVVDAHNTLIGIVSYIDVLRALRPDTPAASSPDTRH
jgi:CBS domain-containing protein